MTRRPITPATARRIQAMHQDGYTRRRIAEVLSVSERTIWRVTHGHWHEKQRAREQRQAAPRPQPQPLEEPLPSGPYVRCRGCGGKVQMPCRLCRLRARQTTPAPQ